MELICENTGTPVAAQILPTLTYYLKTEFINNILNYFLIYAGRLHNMYNVHCTCRFKGFIAVNETGLTLREKNMFFKINTLQTFFQTGIK